MFADRHSSRGSILPSLPNPSPIIHAAATPARGHNLIREQRSLSTCIGTAQRLGAAAGPGLNEGRELAMD
jgi:hypothetical protein